MPQRISFLHISLCTIRYSYISERLDSWKKNHWVRGSLIFCWIYHKLSPKHWSGRAQRTELQVHPAPWEPVLEPHCRSAIHRQYFWRGRAWRWKSCCPVHSAMPDIYVLRFWWFYLVFIYLLFRVRVELYLPIQMFFFPHFSPLHTLIISLLPVVPSIFEKLMDIMHIMKKTAWISKFVLPNKFIF